MNCRKAFATRLLLVGLLAIGPSPAYVWGQAEGSASIVGTVTDASGAAIPNVTVKVTSPALQVPQVTANTDAEGNYKLLGLPAPGVYQAWFEAAGFQTFVRGGLNLGVGFSARVDATMKVGAVTQTVEVTGESPVVDTVNTTGSSTLVETELQTIPRGTGFNDLYALAPGVSVAGSPDVGDSNLAGRGAISTYGVPLQPTLDFEGINIVTGHDENTATYFDAFSLGETEFKTSGNNADVALPGLAMTSVMKSGSNTFHGDAQIDYENPKFQSNNITPAYKAQGLNVLNQIVAPGFLDYNVDLGGRIVRDRLWFFGGTSRESAPTAPVGFIVAAGPSGCWSPSTTCTDWVPGHSSVSLTQREGKASYQVRPTVKLIAAYQYALKYTNSASPLVHTTQQHQPGSVWKGEVQASPSTHLLIDALAGHGGYHVNYVTEPASALKGFGLPVVTDTDFLGDPTQTETNNSAPLGTVSTGPASGPNDRPQNRFEAKGSVSYLPSGSFLGGTHQLKFGTDETWEEAATKVLHDNNAGDYLLQFNTPAGVVNSYTNPTLFDIVLYNYPVLPSNNLFSQSLFATDTWSAKRVTMNLGVRWERYHSFYPTQTKPVGQMSGYSDKNGPLYPAGSFPAFSALTWNDVVPRAGAAWDVKGNGKTVLKGSFSLFGDTMGDLFANNFNPNSIASTPYTWSNTQIGTDGINYGGCYTWPGVANVFVYDEYKCDVNPGWFTKVLPTLTPLAGATGGLLQVPNAGLKQNKTYEYTARLERQLIPNVALDLAYVYHSLPNLYSFATSGVAVNGINVGHPYSSYTQAVQFTQTGNGSTAGAPVTVYTYPSGTPTQQGCPTTILPLCSANEVLNSPSSRPDTYHSFEVSVTKRYSKRWNASSSFWVTKNHRWIQAVPGSPNDDYFPIDNTWNWQTHGTISYNFPHGIEVSSLFRAQSGVYGQATEVFNAGSANCTVAAACTIMKATLGSATLRMGPYGQYQGPFIPVLNVKVDKKFSLGETRQLEMDFQLFNVTNSSAATATTYIYGSKFNFVTSAVSPRVARVGAFFSF